MDRALLRSYTLQRWRGDKMCFRQLRAALVSPVYLIVFLSGCATLYAMIGEASAIELVPDSYRVAFTPTGYISWGSRLR